MTSTDKNRWQLIDQNTVYDGWFKIQKLRFVHSLFNGGMSDTVEMEVFERGHVGALLPYDPVLDVVLLVEQFRIGARHQSTGPWLTEIIAGMIEPGESAEAMVRREATEEAGIRVNSLIPVRRYLASPGGSTEEVAIFCTLMDLSDAGGTFGIAAEQEDIRVRLCTADEAIALLDSGEIRNAISVIALQWFVINRASLQQRGRDRAS